MAASHEPQFSVLQFFSSLYTMLLPKSLSRAVMSAYLRIRAYTRYALVVIFLLFFGLLAVFAAIAVHFTNTIGLEKEGIPFTERSYASSIVDNCVSRTPGHAGRSFETAVRGVGIKFVSWTPNATFDKETVHLRTHEAVRTMGKFRRPATILDVGANIGKVTFPVMAMRQTHTVIAVEPVRNNMDMLCMTANLNGWLGHPGLTLVQAAMSDKPGNISIFVPEGREDNAALSSAAATANVHKPKHGENVKLIVADELLAQGRLKPDVIKIDTQGHEIHVLRGLRKYLARAPAGDVLVMAESDPKLMALSGINPKDIYKLMMTELGYSPYCQPSITVVDDRLKVSGAEISKASYPPGGCRDIFYFKQPQ